ncbi:MAG TPA: 3-hydroxyacyl-CoA dehydrogenase [Rhodospirillaceae bacterium]|nr:3-hydroxyacyl-CoA dehydrogenase [Rhodospirillaceae bacterium]|tara:strand:- start:61 stop:816 length:756 start_codon:yes stop_codon:yes gene_type:complete
MNLSGISAVITGGASGLGAATARHIAALGAKVALVDINAESCAQVAKEVDGLALSCDVTDAASTEKALSDAKQKHGTARLVVNCAGIAPAAKVVGKNGPHDLELFRKVIEVNLIGSFNVLRLAASEMIALDSLADGERGVVINTASIAGYEGQIGQAAYSSSKGGVIGLTLPAARELARSGIRIVAIAPGLIETPMFNNLAPAAVEKLVASTIFPKRLGKPEEYARLVQHIAENVLINGTTIRMDGSIRMN